MLLSIINTLFQFFYFMIILRVILSYLPRPINPNISRFIYQITEPVLVPFRAALELFIPRGTGHYLDFSPLFALVFLNFFRRIVIRILLAALH